MTPPKSHFSKVNKIRRMKASIYLCAVLPLLALAANEDEYPVIQGNNQFANHLYKILYQRLSGNLVYSPLTTHALLTMAYQGAEGTTAETFKSALGVPSPSKVAESYKSLFTAIRQTAGGNVIVATKIYLQYGSRLKPSFQQVLTEQYGSEGNMLDFTEKESATRSINNWVKQKTFDKIPEIVTPSDFYDGTKMILINAIYFRAFWDVRFDPQLTKPAPFYVTEVQKSVVPMMHVEAVLRYKDDTNLNAQVLELTYKNTPLSLLVILPKHRAGLKRLEETLTRTNLAEVSPTEFRLVNVTLPKFRIASTVNLVEPLKQLGLQEIFDESKANFNGVLEGSEHVCIGNIIQKTYLEVDENGSEAASSPSVRFHAVPQDKPSQGTTVVFEADHPFVFYLVNQHRTTTAILQGRVENL